MAVLVFPPVLASTCRRTRKRADRDSLCLTSGVSSPSVSTFLPFLVGSVPCFYFTLGLPIDCLNIRSLGRPHICPGESRVETKGSQSIRSTFISSAFNYPLDVVAPIVDADLEARSKHLDLLVILSTDSCWPTKLDPFPAPKRNSLTF